MKKILSFLSSFLLFLIISFTYSPQTIAAGEVCTYSSTPLSTYFTASVCTLLGGSVSSGQCVGYSIPLSTYITESICVSGGGTVSGGSGSSSSSGGATANTCRIHYTYTIDKENSSNKVTAYTNNTSSYTSWGGRAVIKTGKDKHCNGAGCGFRAGVQCSNNDYAIRVKYQYSMRGLTTGEYNTGWSTTGTSWGGFAKLRTGQSRECNGGGCKIRMLVEANNPNVTCNIEYFHRTDESTSAASNGTWATVTNVGTGDGEDCEKSTGCGMDVRISCIDNTPSVCTPNTTDSQTQSCGTGYNGNQTRTRTCNSAGSAWSGWNSWNRVNCTLQACSPNSTDTTTQACGTGFNGNQSGTRTCNGTGTAWSGWTWNTSSCVAQSCVPNSVDTDVQLCPSGYAGNQTGTRTCNATGTAYGTWTWNTSSCVEIDNTGPTGTISYNPGGRWGPWTTNNRTMTIACSDSQSGCNMLNIPGWTVSGNSYVRIFSSNQNGFITLTDNDGNTSLVWYSMGYIDTTYPSAPTITANDRTNNVWSSDNTTTLSTTIDTVGQISTRYNQYCMGVSCTPNSTTLPSTSNLPNGTHYYRVRTCTQAGNCSPVSQFIIKIDTTTPGAPTITADDRSSDVWSNDDTTIITSIPNTTGQISTRYNQYCMGNSCTPNSTALPNTSSLSDGTYYYRVRTCTEAGRCGTTAQFIIKIDTVTPTAADIGIVPGTAGKLLAVASHNFQVNGSDNGGSPIASMQGFFEDASTTNTYLATPFTSSSAVLNINASVENVDRDRETGQYRWYSLYMYRVCDEAGNCIQEFDADGIETFSYQVYANTSSVGTRNIQVNELDSSTNIADGSSKNLSIELEDIYGNEIVPASGINRTIDFDFNANSSLYMNQHERNGGSAVFINSIQTETGALSTTTFSNQSSSNGIYDFSFEVYTPTYQNTKADPNGIYDVSNITVDIAGDIGGVSDVVIDNSNIDFDFAPLYTTQITGELRSNGFIEGAVQNSNISVSKTVSSENGASTELHLKYGGDTTALSKLNLLFSRSLNPSTLVSEGSGLTSFVSNFSSTNYPLITSLTQQAGATLESIQQTFLSTHISYTLNGKSVVYNGDVLGKSNYWDSVIENNTNQAGIKIVGISSSDRTQAITNNQLIDNVTILGKLTKSSSRRDIQSSVYKVIKNIEPNNNGSNSINNLTSATWLSNSDGVKISNNRVLYFGNLGGLNVEIGNGVTETVEGKKTIVIEGGNLYITSNMEYGNPDDILGIVVLQDEDGNGGNLYIDPSVTHMVGTIYTDKSVLSYNGTNVLDGNTPVSTLSNQLYIFGSLFSENTIGGSRANPIQCPYYISVCTNTVDAQKYDLNYLRRYFVNQSGVPSGNTIFTNTDNYYNYPVVVEYNSRIQSSPPPFFD